MPLILPVLFILSKGEPFPLSHIEVLCRNSILFRDLNSPFSFLITFLVLLSTEGCMLFTENNLTFSNEAMS